MLHSKRLLLRALQPSDLSSTYLSWLNDADVNRYLETRFLPQTMEALQSYWQNHRDDPANPWFAICLVEDGVTLQHQIRSHSMAASTCRSQFVHW